MSQSHDPRTDPTTEAPSAEAPSTDAPVHQKDPLRGSRTSGAWAGVVVAAVLLLLLVVFIAQNTQDVQISFLVWDGQAPLSVALLVAAAAGITLAAIVGTMRIWQLRRRVRHDRR
ncbi:lipopolysaccharide assembly protein LapA domain-containing protein [Nocardioides sp.]|uniref:lipopolysaccharide assembly protein LapA domain-containing protein n=1 Tax=Nocardioides sp. TaxID=35761 RepID=UPI0037835166